MQTSTSTQQLREYLETKKGKTYLISIITMITVAVMLIFAVVPAVKSITDKIAQNKVREEYLNALELKDKNIKSLLAEEELNGGKIVQLNNSLPDKRNDEYILANIGSIVIGTNNSLISADFSDEREPKFNIANTDVEFLKQIPLTLSIQGNLSTLGEFLKRIESFPTILTVENISTSNKNVQNLGLSAFNGDTVMTLKINYYYYYNVTK